MAGPDRGAIGAWRKCVSVDMESQRSVVPRCQVAGNFIFGARDDEISNPVREAVERDAQAREWKRRVAVARIEHV